MGKKKKKIDIPDNVKQLGMAKKKFAKKNDLPYKMKGKEFSKKEKKHAVKEFNKEYASIKRSRFWFSVVCMNRRRLISSRSG